jgi:TonB family protein
MPSGVAPRLRELGRLATALLLALALVGALFWTLAELTRFDVQPGSQAKGRAAQAKSAATSKPKPGRMRVASALPPKPPGKPQQPPPVTDLNGQVVETAKPAREQAPKNAKYLGRYDMTVAKEQKSSGRRSNGRDLGKAALERPSEVQSPQSDSKEPTRIAAKAARQAPTEPGEEAPQQLVAPTREGPGIAPQVVPGSPQPQGASVVRGAHHGLLLPATSAGNIRENLQTLAGSPGGSDYLPDVEDEGDVNLLNTRRFKYWDFFQRVKDRVQSEWQPGVVWRSRDPNGQRYGIKPRLTVLRVTLDPEGAVKQLQVARTSQLGFLDDEASRAFSAAGPFPNPPRDLVRNGEVEFQFGFMFEVGSNKFKFFRVPP